MENYHGTNTDSPNEFRAISILVHIQQVSPLGFQTQDAENEQLKGEQCLFWGRKQRRDSDH
jgi:hypothetical protein